MTSRLTGPICALIAAVVVAATCPRAYADPNPHYRPGDWRAFTTVRYVTSVAFTPDYLYFGTRGGVARYDRQLDRWAVPLTTAEGLPSNLVRRLAYNSLSDDLYAETWRGNAVYRRMWDEWRDEITFPDTLVQNWQTVDLSQYELPLGYDALTPGFLTDPHLQSYKVAGGLEDSWGTLWIATWGRFVWRRSFGGFELQPQQWGLFHDNVEAIFRDSGTVYFGGTNYYSPDGALSIYDTIAGTWGYVESRYAGGMASDRIHQFAGKPGGRFLYMATDAGVVRLDRQSLECRTYGLHQGLTDDRIWSLCLDGDILWVGTETGVDGIYLPRDSVFSASTELVRLARVLSILAGDKIVWLGTDRGLFRLAKPVPEWIHFSLAEGPLSGNVRVIRSDGRHVYVGTDRGIGAIDPEGKEPLVGYDRGSGLPDDNIFDLAITDSILWAATPSGLVRFVPATRERRLFTSDDGLLDGFVQTIVVDGDYLWLGTERGANRFRWNNPDRID